MFQHPFAHQTGVPATHRGKEQKVPNLQSTVTSQPKKLRKNKFSYLQVTDIDVNKVLSLTNYRSLGKINFHAYRWQTWMSRHLT